MTRDAHLPNASWLYATYRIRDWRWLWLRHKTVHEIIASHGTSP